MPTESRGQKVVLNKGENMNLKKSFSGNFGYEKIITKENSPLKYTELDMLKLREGESYTINELNKEFVLVVYYGTCTVKGDNFNFDSVGKRKSVFEGLGECVYVGKDTAFTVTAKTEVKICVAKAPAEKYFEPQYIAEENIKTKSLGKGAYVREAAFNFDAEPKANLLYIGEFWVEDGKWASFPPHKHDEDNMPTEGFLDEVYYFEFDKPSGFGVQMVYSKDGEINEAYKVQNGDFVEIPKGYHPFVTAPNYKNYCLWIMAGKDRGIFCTTDPEHKWML